MSRSIDYLAHRLFMIEDFELLYGLNLLLCDVFYHYHIIIPALSFALRQYALNDPRWTVDRILMFKPHEKSIEEYFRGNMDIRCLTKEDVVRLTYMKRAMPIASYSTVKEFEKKHFDYFHIFPTQIDFRLYDRAYKIAYQYSKKTKFSEFIFQAPYLSGACLEFTRSMGGSAGYLNFLIKYYRIFQPTSGPYHQEIRLAFHILKGLGIVELDLSSLLDLSSQITTATNDLVLFICLRECNSYLEHAKVCKHGLCNEKEKHPKVLSFAVAEHGKARGVTLNEACVSTLAAYVRPIGTHIMSKQKGFEMAFSGIRPELIQDICNVELRPDDLVHSGDQIKATDNFPFALSFNIWRGFIDGCSFLTESKKIIFRHVAYMTCGPQLLMPPESLRDNCDSINLGRSNRSLFYQTPIKFLSSLDKSEWELQNTLKEAFKEDFMYDFKVSVTNLLIRQFDSLRFKRKKPQLGKNLDFKRNHLLERDGQVIHSFDDLWKTFIKKIEGSPQLLSLERVLMSRLKETCNSIYDHKDSYLTRHGILMSSPLSFPTLNFMNILGKEISKARLTQFFYGDDELSIGNKQEIDKFLTSMKNLGLIYSDDKDVLSSKGGIFVEIPFHRKFNRLVVIPVIKSKIYCPTDATYLDAFSTLKHSLSSSPILNSRASIELTLKFNKQIQYLSSRGVPLDLIPPLGGLSVSNPPYNDNCLWFLKRIPSIFECQPQETINFLLELKKYTARSSKFLQRLEFSHVVSGQLLDLPGYRVNFSGVGLPLLPTIENLSNQLYASQMFLGDFGKTHELVPHYKTLAMHLIGFVGKLKETTPRSPEELEKAYSSFRKSMCFTAVDTSIDSIQKVCNRKLSSSFFT